MNVPSTQQSAVSTSEVVIGAGSGHEHGLRFWVTTAIGWLIIAYALRGVVHHHIDTRPANLARFVVLSALLHDLVFAPVVLVIGVLVNRLLPGRPKKYIKSSLLSSGIVVLFAFPLVRGYGHSLPNNPGYLPHNYTIELAIVVAAIWLGWGVVSLIEIARLR